MLLPSQFGILVLLSQGGGCGIITDPDSSDPESYLEHHTTNMLRRHILVCPSPPKNRKGTERGLTWTWNRWPVSVKCTHSLRGEGCRGRLKCSARAVRAQCNYLGV